MNDLQPGDVPSDDELEVAPPSGADGLEKDTEEPTTMLSVEEIIAAGDITEKVLDVPDWGGKVRIRGFTKGEQQDLRRDCTKGDELDTDRLELLTVARGIIEPKFADDQVGQLRQKSATVLDRVLGEIMTLSGTTDGAQAGAERRFPD